MITSVYLRSEDLEQRNRDLQKKYGQVAQHHTLYDAYRTEKASHLIIAFGLASQICRKAIDSLQSEGHRIGLIRPITLFPFPAQVIEDHAKKVKGIMVIEMNLGQMVQDVVSAVKGETEVQFYGRTGGATPTVEEIVKELKKFIGKK